MRFRLSLLLFLLASPSMLLAHRLDEYLQATLVVLEPARIRLQINLEPGVAVAESVLTYIDPDNNRVISSNEASAYARALQSDLTLRIDGQAIPLQLIGSVFPTLSELRSGSGIIQLEYSAAFNTLAVGAHRLNFENRHLSKESVYLFNAAQPDKNTIQITRQQRTPNQSTGEIDFSYQSGR